MILDSLDRIAIGDHLYQPLEVRRCLRCERDTPHETTDVALTCCVCRRKET